MMTATRRPCSDSGRSVADNIPASACAAPGLAGGAEMISDTGSRPDRPLGRGPGHPFGPESVLSATGSSSVVYWVPGPLLGPTPPPSRSAIASPGRAWYGTRPIVEIRLVSPRSWDAGGPAG